MKRIEVELKIKMIIDVVDNQDITDVVDGIEISEYEIPDNSKIIAANITKRDFSNFIK